MTVSDKNKRVYVTLPDEVVNELQEKADKDMRSLSSMTAIMVIRGLQATKKGESYPLGGSK